ncbi:DNA-binding MarR family transcriptional regulator [Deinococcus metalli]|nr:MarR family transcriptional regulator [Deinococcus metalli]MBB5377535.1 DNA-binding MarR family transcriptional regulator [Deinococcus metalli]
MSFPEAAPLPAATDLHAQPLRFLTAYWGVWQGLSGRANDRLGAHGLDLRSFIALSYVQGQPTSPGELARVLDVPKYEVTRILDRLTALGAITRDSDPANARSRRLDVTPSGRALWHAAVQTVTAVVGPALATLGPRVDPLTADLEHLAALTEDTP